MITHTNRLGNTYFLKVGKTKKGNPKYYCSTKEVGTNAASVPDGYEIYEDVNGGVFFRKQRPCFITRSECEMIETTLRPFGHLARSEAEGAVLIVYHSSRAPSPFDDSPFLVRAMDQIQAFLKLAHYDPVFRFELIDRKRRVFQTFRMCYRKDPADCIPLGDPLSLEVCVGTYIPHLGKQSFFDLID